MIAVATSILPMLTRKNGGADCPQYQRLCLQSWMANGFRVLSVNQPEEIEALAPDYPEVEFVAATRDAGEWTGRKNPYIADLIAALLRTDAPVLGILNSDLLFEASSAWRENLPSLVPHAMVVAHRYNARSLSGGSLRRYLGLDCFFFDKITAQSLVEDAMPYAMGLPWWDCWLPCMALLNRRRIIVVDRPAVIHLTHKQAYSARSWRAYAKLFSQSMIRGAQRFEPVPEAIAALLPLFRQMEAHALDGRNFNHLTAEFSKAFVSLVRADPVSWIAAGAPKPPPTMASLDGMFVRFEERAAAGHALMSAKELAASNKWSDIGPELVADLAKVTDDPEVAQALGGIYLHRGDLGLAQAQFELAVKLAPEDLSAPLMLGNTLARRGRNREALDCFQRIQALHPSYQPAYTAEAEVLWRSGEKTEAVERLQRAVTGRPEFSAAARLCDSYRQQLQSGVRKSLSRFLNGIWSTRSAKRPSSGIKS